MKRSVQSFLFLRAFSSGPSAQVGLVPAILAKLVVIQSHFRELYRRLSDDTSLLATLEVQYRRTRNSEADTPYDILDSAAVDLALRWSERYPLLPSALLISVGADDSFEGVNLADYLTFFRAVAADEAALVSIPDTVEPSSELQQRWVVPVVGPGTVARNAELEMLVVALTSGTGAGLVGLVGAGGFGKTTLAALACRDPRVRKAFPGGVVWASLGRDRVGPALAAHICDLCEFIGGPNPSVIDPHLAGRYLGRLLEQGEPTLLVLDDVVSEEQLRPFLTGSPRTVRLATTRNRGALPPDSALIVLDAFSPSEALAVLLSDIPSLTREPADRLAQVTGRWPLLLSLVRGALLNVERAGGNVNQAAWDLIERIGTYGPSVLDAADASDRTRSVHAAVDASLQILGDDGATRVAELSAFPEDTKIPVDWISRLWHVTGNLEHLEVIRLLERCFDLSLVDFDSDFRSVSMHEVLRAHFRSLMRARLEELEEIVSTIVDDSGHQAGDR